MKSPLPKVLHPIGGVPMIKRIVSVCQQASIHDIRVVVGYGGQLVKAVIAHQGVQIFHQAQQLGTGDAVKAAQLETLSGDVVILNGDHPLVEVNDLAGFFQSFRERSLELAVVTCTKNNPGQFGRIIRHQGDIKAIVEAKDASADTLKIKEVNTGVYLVKADMLQDYIPRIQNLNSKGEYYLTDMVSMAVDDQCKVSTIPSPSRVSFGVNTQFELAQANKWIFQKKNRELLADGVLMLNPDTVYIEPSVMVASGVVIHPNVYLKGTTKIGSFTSIESNCFLIDSEVGESVILKASSYLEKCKIQNRASVGPFARIRPGTDVGEEAHVGNFVEMKNVKFGAKSKAGHLTYLGDAEVGMDTNIGCGTITCNYAVNRQKYVTKIGTGVFVGSDSQFIAPVEIGDHAVIGSGSTITKNVPARALAVARTRQVIKENYVRPVLQSESRDETEGEEGESPLHNQGSSSKKKGD